MNLSKDREPPRHVETDKTMNAEENLQRHRDNLTDSFKPNARFFVVLTALFLMVFIVAVNDGILGVALPVS